MVFLYAWTKIQAIREKVARKVAVLYEKRRLRIEEQLRKGLLGVTDFKNIRKISISSEATIDTIRSDTTRRMIEGWVGMDFDDSDHEQSQETDFNEENEAQQEHQGHQLHEGYLRPTRDFKFDSSSAQEDPDDDDYFKRILLQEEGICESWI